MYALANQLVGFPYSILRVKVERIEPGYVWVRTADVCDAGTALVLSPEQVSPERDGFAVYQHPRGLVVID